MENYVGEIRIFAGPYAPAGWAYCQGQLLSTTDYEPLFRLLGTTYGGDGQATFALPDLRSRVAAGVGQVYDIPYALGTTAGQEAVSLLVNQMAMHWHAVTGRLRGLTAGTPQNAPTEAYFGAQGGNIYHPTPNAALGSGAIISQMTYAGGGQAHSNIQPVLALNYIIALTGLDPALT